MAKTPSNMSVVYITQHNESIYNVIKRDPPKPKKSPPYKSKFKENVKSEYKHRKQMKQNQHATMGLANEPVPNPQDFLKRRSRSSVSLRPQTKNEEPRCLKDNKLPPVPDPNEMKKLERTCKATQTDRNFLSENVQYVVEKEARVPKKFVVFNQHGDKENIAGVLEPRYIYSSKFGKKPEYLRKFLRLRRSEVESKNKEEVTEPCGIHCITNEEREKLLKGLKRNLEELHKRYLALPIFTDTLPKINRKLKLEADLKQLERDIELLEKHPSIFVYDDEP